MKCEKHNQFYENVGGAFQSADELLDDLAEAACQLGSLKYKTCVVCMKTDVARRCNCVGEQP